MVKLFSTNALASIVCASVCDTDAIRTIRTGLTQHLEQQEDQYGRTASVVYSRGAKWPKMRLNLSPRSRCEMPIFEIISLNDMDSDTDNTDGFDAIRCPRSGSIRTAIRTQCGHENEGYYACTRTQGLEHSGVVNDMRRCGRRPPPPPRGRRGVLRAPPPPPARGGTSRFSKREWPMTPTQRTLKALRSRGLQAEICERWLPHVHRGGGGFGIRRDLFGWIDIVALDMIRGVGGIQSTGTDFAAHWAKLREQRASQVRSWLEAGGWGELWGWRKLKGRWVPRVKVLTLADFGSPWA